MESRRAKRDFSGVFSPTDVAAHLFVSSWCAIIAYGSVFSQTDFLAAKPFLSLNDDGIDLLSSRVSDIVYRFCVRY